MAEILTHTFVNPHADSADGTLTASSEWNDGHSFGGGADGQFIVKDSGQVKGARWTMGPLVNTATANGAGGVTTTTMCTITLTFTSSVALMLFMSAAALLSDSTTVKMSLRRDGVEILVTNFPGSDGLSKALPTHVLNEAAGTHTYGMVLSSVNGTATLTTWSARLSTFVVGT